MRNNRTILLAAALVFVTANCGVAATIDVDTVLGPGHPYPNEAIVVVDGVSPPTTVTILDGAVIGGVPGQSGVPTAIDAYGSSVIDLLGGIVVATEHPALLHDESVFRARGGNIALIETRDASRAILDSGRWGGAFAYDNSRVYINGGDDDWIFSVKTFGQAHAVVNSPFIELDLIADESSTAVVNGGVFEIARMMGNSEVLLNSGFFVAGMDVSENAVVRMRGLVGLADEEAVVSDSAELHIYGANLRFDVIVDIDEEYPVVLGTFANGDDFGFRYRLEDQGQIILHEVPEPATWALLAIGAAGWAFFRRRVAG